ncbi:MAG: type II secretion system F family protein [Motilibacteraceae bacterium]
MTTLERELLVAALSAAAAALAVVGVGLATASPRVRGIDVTDQGGGESDQAWYARGYEALVQACAAPALRLLGPWWRGRMQDQLLRAGRPEDLSMNQLAGQKAVLLVTGGAGGLAVVALGHTLLGVGFVLLSAAYLDLRVVLRARARQQQVEDALPDFLDVLAVTVSGGLGLRPAMARVGELTRGPLAEEVRVTLREMDFGVSRRAAFEGLRTRNGGCPSLGAFVGGVLQAEELGAPVLDTLVSLAADLRQDYAQEMRRRAGRVESRVTLVMTVVLLPAVSVLIIAALLLSSSVNLGVLLGGR